MAITSPCPWSDPAVGLSSAGRDRELDPSPTTRIRDHRIQDVVRLIDGGRYDVLSLDVFDTLVWRKVVAPIDAFFLVAHKLLDRGAMRRSSSPASFVTERTKAEERARRRRISHEVTLAEIYDEFPSGYLHGISPQDVAAIEFDTEKEIVCLHPEMPLLIAHARGRGMRVALVSDTYLSSSQVRDLVGVEVDRILVSSEKRVSKYHGLHRSLIEEFGVAPGRILHVGDNQLADIEGPALLGIERYWFRAFPDGFERMIDSEIPKVFSHRAPFFETDDRGVTALRSRAIYACHGRYERWGAGVLGPVVAGFCDWVIERCRNLQITTALCLMREGRILKRCLDAQGSPLEAHELFASRYVALRSAIFDASEEELMRFLYRPSAQRRGVLLNQLGLEPADAGGEDPDEIIPPEETIRLIRRVAGSAEARRKVAASSAAIRRGLLAHLASIATPNGLVAILDLGYRGTIQDSIDRILERERIPIRTHGLYLVTGGEVRTTQAGGSVAEGWLAENGQPVAVAQTFVRSPEIVEQSLMAECGTTLGYEESGGPILDEFRIPPDQRAQIGEIQRGILTYAEMWSAHKARHAIRVDAPDSRKAIYESICVRAIARPLEAEIELFGSWVHDENFGSSASHALIDVAGMDEWEISHISAHQIASLPHSRLYWPFGFARRMSPRMGEAVAQIFLRTAEPEAFDSCDTPRRIGFYWDSGAGFNPGESRISEYSLNNRGKAWRRFSLSLSSGRNRMFAFAIGSPGEVLQLTGAIVRIHPKGVQARTVRVPHEEMSMAGYAHLHGDLYLVKEDPAVLAFPTGDLADFTGTVDVDIFFSVIPIGCAA